MIWWTTCFQTLVKPKPFEWEKTICIVVCTSFLFPRFQRNFKNSYTERFLAVASFWWSMNSTLFWRKYRAWKYFSELWSYDSYLIYVCIFSIYLLWHISFSFCENWCFQNNLKVRIFKYQKIPKTNSQAADHALESFKRI